MKKPKKINKLKKIKKVKSKSNYISFYENFENKENENFIKAEITREYIKKTLKFREADVLQINIKYPVFSVASKSNTMTAITAMITKKINDFYDSAVRSFMNFCEKKLYKSAAMEFLLSRNAGDYQEFKPFGAVITFETPYTTEYTEQNSVCSVCAVCRNGFLCVCLDINIYSGKGRGNVIRKTQIWNLTNGELYSPKRIINFNKHTKKIICEYICTIMERRIKKGEERYINADAPSVCRQNVYKHLSIDNLYLAGNGYAFSFPQGTVAPRDCGIVDFVVPESVLNSMNL